MVRSGSRGSAMLNRTGGQGRRPGRAPGSPPLTRRVLRLRPSSFGLLREVFLRIRRRVTPAARADTGHKEGDRKEGRDPAGRAHPGLHLWAPSVPPQQSISALDRLGVWGLEHAGLSRGRAFISAEAEREHPLGEVAPHDAGNGPQGAQESEHVGSSGEEPHDPPQGIGDGAAQCFELQVRGGGLSWNRARDPIRSGRPLGRDRRPDAGRVLRTARQPRRDRRLTSRVDGGRRTPFLSAAGQDCHDRDGRQGQDRRVEPRTAGLSGSLMGFGIRGVAARSGQRGTRGMVARSGTGGILSGVGEDEIKRALPGPQAVGQLPELEPVLAGPEIDRTTPRSRRHVAHVRDIGPSRGCPLVEVDGDGDHFDVARDIDVRRRDARDERVGLQVVGDPAPAGVR